MAKANQRGRTKYQNFVMLTYNLMDSSAWLSLSAHSQALWVHLRRRYKPDNNGKIPLSVREAAALLNCGKAKASESFDQLLDRGFIKIGKDSNFDQKEQSAREWIFTHEIMNGKAPTNDWKEWEN